jgi:Arc/MetJ family transcription regulator
MQAAGARSKRETVEMGLRALVQLSQQAEFRNVRGKLRWEGSLDNQRLDGPTTLGSGEPA